VVRKWSVVWLWLANTPSGVLVWSVTGLVLAGYGRWPAYAVFA
jgi:hypothetical protein